jgi:hypothetical protein
MNLQKALIIDGEKFDSQIEMLKTIISNTEKPNTASLEIASLNTLLQLKQHAKSALPIVEDAFYNGIACTNSYSDVWKLIKGGDFRGDLGEYLSNQESEK